MKVPKWWHTFKEWRDVDVTLPKGYGLCELTMECTEMYEGRAPLNGV